MVMVRLLVSVIVRLDVQEGSLDGESGSARESSESSMQAVKGVEIIVPVEAEMLWTWTSHGQDFGSVNAPMGYVWVEKFPSRRELEYPPRIRVPFRKSEGEEEGMP